MTAWTLEVRRAGAWVLLDQFHDRDSACTALAAVLRDYGGDDVRLRKVRQADDVPALVTRGVA